MNWIYFDGDWINLETAYHIQEIGSNGRNGYRVLTPYQAFVLDITDGGGSEEKRIAIDNIRDWLSEHKYSR